METHLFQEFEAYASTVEDADLRMMLPRLEQPRWEIDIVSAGEIHIQYGREGSGNIAEGVARTGGRVLYLPVAGSHLANGMPLDSSTVLVIGPAAEFTIAVQEAHDWFSVFIPFDLPSRLGPDGGSDRSVQGVSRVVRCGKEPLARLRTLISRLIESARIEPTILTDPTARIAVQADLLAACQPVIGFNPVPRIPSGRPSFCRRDIIRTVDEWIERCPDAVLRVDDLAAAAGVSVRTLRNAFLDYYGVPPLQYFRMIRLHKVRAVLREADSRTTTVTAAAVRFGFWEFGRFAGEYRRVFGERPSDTLRHGRQYPSAS